MLFTSGYWQRGEFERVPLRWHWSLLVGLAIACRWELRPVAGLLYLGLVQFHLMAHAWSVRRARLVAIGVDLQGLGGKVRWNGVATPPVQVRHAWVGVLAQLVLCGIAQIVVGTSGTERGAPGGSWLEDLAFVWVEMNLVMVAVNLLPLPSFDGETAWRIWELMRGREIPQRRLVIIEVSNRNEKPRRVDSRQVELEVEAQLAELARAHNAQAHAESDGLKGPNGLTATRAPAGRQAGDRPRE